VVTTYQANKLLVLREQQGGLSILVRTFARPMGVPNVFALTSVSPMHSFAD
jgi:hypothetical protein